MTNSRSIDDTFRDAWCNRVVAKQEDSHSTGPADNKQMNKDTLTPPPRILNIKLI